MLSLPRGVRKACRLRTEPVHTFVGDATEPSLFERVARGVTASADRLWLENCRSKRPFGAWHNSHLLFDLLGSNVHPKALWEGWENVYTCCCLG